MPEEETPPAVGMPRARWDRERRVSRQSVDDVVIGSWINALFAWGRRHWPWITATLATGLGALLYNVYVLGGMANMVNINIDRLSALSTNMTEINLHVRGLEVHHDDLTARVDTLERYGSPSLQALRAQVESLAIGYHELYPMVSKDLHDLIARIEGLQEHSKGDNERFEALRAADADIRQRLNMLQERQNVLADRVNGRAKP